MPSPINLPTDVVDFLHKVFSATNLRVTRKISRMPSTHETALDLSLIEALSQHNAPIRFGSGWLVKIDTHYLGGGRHFGSWEVADVGIIVQFRQAGSLVRSKIGLLQSKRLYPTEQEYEEDTRMDYLIGFGRLYEDDDSFLQVTHPRTFAFGKSSQYKALVVGNNQWNIIAQYEKRRGIPVHYLLYHPLRIPFTTRVPRSSNRAPRGPSQVGARVVPASSLRTALENRTDGHVPSYGDLEFLLPRPFDIQDNTAGWRLEAFITELLITCEEGYIAQQGADEGLEAVFNRRAGPIAAAMSITFDAPPG